MYSAVIFDLDGLILDTETLSHSAWQQVVSDMGLALEDNVYHKIMGLGIPAAQKVFTDAFGPDFPFHDVNQQRLQYMYNYIDEHGVPVKPGLVDLLDFIDKAGLPKAVATSSIRDFAVCKLTAAGLIDRFDTMVCGDEVQNGKPAPEPFLQAAKRLNVAAEKSLVFEDSENGVRSAHSAGMTVIMVPDLKQPSKEIVELTHRIFDSLHEAIPFLRECIVPPI